MLKVIVLSENLFSTKLGSPPQTRTWFKEVNRSSLRDIEVVRVFVINSCKIKKQKISM